MDPPVLIDGFGLDQNSWGALAGGLRRLAGGAGAQGRGGLANLGGKMSDLSSPAPVLPAEYAPPHFWAYLWGRRQGARGLADRGA